MERHHAAAQQVLGADRLPAGPVGSLVAALFGGGSSTALEGSEERRKRRLLDVLTSRR